MVDTLHNKKRIAVNTLFLYLRMLMTMSIGLFTTRIVLAALGESDYGIYNVVGGFVAMFGMLSASMAAAAQRFLSYEIGKGENGDIKSTFTNSILIHIILALVILVIGETAGVWFVNTQLNIPECRYHTANIVYQYSLATFLINILSVPYNAALIAFEKMKAFAYVSILEALAKLSIAYYLVITSSDKLLLYALLQAIVAILIRVLYSWYVKRNIKECKCTWRFYKPQLKEMLSFAGWNMFGATAGVVNGGGINVLLNVFFGTIVNAARGIAMQVQNAVSSFVFNFQLAMSPQIIKTHAAGDDEEMFELIFKGARYSFILMLFLSVPVLFEAQYLLNIWLVETPEHTVRFLQISLVGSLSNALSQPLSYAMHASGKVRNYQIVCGTTSIMCLPATYLILKFGGSPESAFISVAVFALLFIIAQLFMLRPMIGISIKDFVLKVIMRSYALFGISLVLPFFVYICCDDSFLSFLIIGIISVLSVLLCSYTFGVDADERLMIKNKVKSIIQKIKKNFGFSN